MPRILPAALSADDVSRTSTVLRAKPPRGAGSCSRAYWPVIGGALLAILLAFPLAALSALLFRFPIPFASYESGWGAALHALAAVRFYGALGGFVLLACLGGLGGVAAHRLGKPDRRRVWRWTISLALAVATCAVVLLATLDYIIGPW